MIFSRKVDHSNAEDWIKINIGQYGYYRVQYPLDEWQKFSRVLQKSPSQFSSSDRTSKARLEWVLTNKISTIIEILILKLFVTLFISPINLFAYLHSF